MPNASSHGWPRATLLALLVPPLLSLPSCMTSMLWCGHDKDSHRAGIATFATTATIVDGGVQAIGAQFAEDLPAGVAQSLDRDAIGRWFAVELSKPSPALAEIVRLRDGGGATNVRFDVWLYRDDDVRIEATASIDDAHLADVHVTPGLRIDRDSNEPTRLRAYASGTLHPAADAPTGSQPLAAASLAWWQKKDEARPLWTKVVLTPVTVVMDVTLLPITLLAGGYMLVYFELGGRG